MQQYPYFSPRVLTDSIFLLYGGHSGTSSAAQRQIAYLLAEEQVTEYLNTFLVPTVVTGTYLWRGENPLTLDYGHLLDIKAVSFNSVGNGNSCSFSSNSGCAFIRNSEYGYLDVISILGCGGCSSLLGTYPYNVQVVYESGFNSGTVTQPAMLQALSMAAQINLNEMDLSLSNEGTADIGIQAFSNQKYYEKRVPLGTSSFGNSPVANRIARLIKKYRSRPSIGFH